MLRDEYLVECNIDDDDEDEEEDDYDDDDYDVKKIHPSPPPPPQFSSTPSLAQVETRDPYGVNKHLKVNIQDVLHEKGITRNKIHLTFCSL